MGQRSHVGVEHLGVQDPGGSVPGGSVEDCPQVEEEHGCDAAAVHACLGVGFGLGDLDVGADDPEADGAAKGADEEQVAATDAVD